MRISPFFLDLYSAYQAELDDLTSDSEGKDVLRRRLADKRKELDFLLKMIELSPEMVAVVLHQAFRFNHPAVVQQLLGRDSDELLGWDDLAGAVQVAPWAQDLVQKILQEPMGDWFMALAVGLEYMHSKPLGAENRAPETEDDADEDRDDNREDRRDSSHTEDDDAEEAEARAREEAGNDWMEQQGFDRKE
jgi:hypothetical protein